MYCLNIYKQLLNGKIYIAAIHYIISEAIHVVMNVVREVQGRTPMSSFFKFVNLDFQ